MSIDDDSVQSQPSEAVAPAWGHRQHLVCSTRNWRSHAPRPLVVGGGVPGQPMPASVAATRAVPHCAPAKESKGDSPGSAATRAWVYARTVPVQRSAPVQKPFEVRLAAATTALNSLVRRFKRRGLRLMVRLEHAWQGLPDRLSSVLPQPAPEPRVQTGATPERESTTALPVSTSPPIGELSRAVSKFSAWRSSGQVADWARAASHAWDRLANRVARAMHRINVHPSAARMMVILVVGFTLVGASLVIARNALENARRVPVARMFNPRLAEERTRMTIERAELIRRCIGAYAGVHGVFPSTLKQLVPEFLPGIPLPLNGATEWQYRVLAPAAGETGSAAGEGTPAGSARPGFSLSFRTWDHPILRQTVVDQDGRWTLAE